MDDSVANTLSDFIQLPVAPVFLIAGVGGGFGCVFAIFGVYHR